SNIFYGGWPYTFIIGFTAYSVLGLIFKPPIYPPQRADTPKTWEYLAETNGFFEDDEYINGVGYPGAIDDGKDAEDDCSDEKCELRVIQSAVSISQG
ncbi:hypothetical protein WICPIJ_003457, partial [Wickerhamomyces pijperi]